MLSFFAEREFIAQLQEMTNYAVDCNKLGLVRIWQKGFAAGQKFEEQVADFILKLPIDNQISSLDFILTKLIYEDSWSFKPVPWWVGELTGYRKYLGDYDRHLLARYAGVTQEEIDNFCHDLAQYRAAVAGEGRMAHWVDVVGALDSFSAYYHVDLSSITSSQAEHEGLLQSVEKSVFSFAAYEIAYQRYCAVALELSKFYASLSSGYHSHTESPHIKWLDRIKDFCETLTAEFAFSDDEKVNKSLVESGFIEVTDERLKRYLQFISTIYDVRQNEITGILNPDSLAESKQLPQTVAIQWKGSKTDLAELGYALLEAGLIGGPREAALKALADFFGQDLGNPAKHLQTLQKRKWNPGDKEPVTPLIDRLRIALRNFLKIKEVAPAKK